MRRLSIPFYDTEEFQRQVAEDEAYYEALGEAMEHDRQVEQQLLEAAMQNPPCNGEVDEPCGICAECVKAEMEAAAEASLSPAQQGLVGRDGLP